MELHVEFPSNAVYGVAHLSGSKAGIVLRLFEYGEVHAPANIIGEDAEGNPRVLWDSRW